MKHDVYKLHIDHHPAPAPSKTPAPRVKTHSASAVSSPAKKSRATHFIKEALHFVGVSLGVFIVLYTFLNWQALSINAVHYWNKLQGVESPLKRLVEEKPAPEEKLVAYETASADGARAAAIPPLNLEVYPPDMRLIIPRINQNVPVIGVRNANLISRKWEELEADIQKALRNGVIHYPGTALPGDSGNVVLTGHSSYYAWDPGRFKDVFALLHDVKVGDKIVLYFNQKKFVYEIAQKKVVTPEQVDVLGESEKDQLTLITCTPIGTNLKRLVVTAKLTEKK